MNSNHKKGSKKNNRPFRVKKKERTKETILIEAEKLFSEKPYHDVFLEEIAEAAFVSRATLYNYFKNKEEVLFAVGSRIIKHENEFLTKNFPTELSGKEQVLFLCERMLQNSIRQRTLLKITQVFLTRVNEKNSTIQRITNDVIDKVGASTSLEPDEDKYPLEKLNLEQKYDKPYFVRYLIELSKNSNLHENVIQKGKEDKTIKNKLENYQIAQYLNLLISGIVIEYEQRKSILDQIGMKKETIITHSLNLMALFLDNKSSPE